MILPITISREDAEVELEVEYSITSFGYPAKMGRLPEDYDPGEGPEWEIEDVYYLDEDSERTVSAMKDLTRKELDKIEDQIKDEVSQFMNNKDNFAPDYDPCAEDPPHYDDY